MTRKRRGISSKTKTIWLRCLIITLVVAVIFSFSMTAYAELESGPSARPMDPVVDTDPGPDPGGDVEPGDSPDSVDDIVAPEQDLPAPGGSPPDTTVPPDGINDLTTSAMITFYKTTTGGGNFGTELFSFQVVRVADKYGNPWTDADETVLDDNGIVTVEAGPNQVAAPAVFSINNLNAPTGYSTYYYKIFELETPGGVWNYDERAFVLRIIVVEVDGNLVVPRQGQEWFYQGVSYDAKGGGNPLPPNDYNTFINEYTGSDTPLGRLKVKKSDFIVTPANPEEIFEFQLIDSNDAPFDLTTPGVTIRRVGGVGTYVGTDLNNGKFTLIYDTEVLIAGLPVGVYSITEFAVGYEISYAVTDGLSGADSTANVSVNEGSETSVVFTNVEMDSDTSLTIRKQLDGEYQSWGVGNNTFYRARIVDARGRHLTLSGTAPNYTFTGTSSTGSVIRFSVNQPAIITGIPIGTIVTVDEIIPSGAFYTVQYTGNGVAIPGGVDRNAEIVVKNSYELDDHGVGNITISKALAGSYSDWGVDENTVFSVRVKDVTNPSEVYYLDFLNQTDGNYEAVAVGTGSPYIQFTAAKPVVLSMLWDDRVYEVEEIGGANFTVAYSGNSFMMSEGGNINVTVTNTYDSGVGKLIISKRLAGSPGDWGVDESTVFTARVKDLADNNYVLFALQSDGSYLAVGNNNSPNPTDDPGELVRFTAGHPIIVDGLWTGRYYEVVEVSGANYTTAYSGNNVFLPDNGNMNVTITNTFEHGTGRLVISKVLAGSPGGWGVDENTVFSVRVKDVTDDNYLLFLLQEDGTYLAFANNGSSTPTKDVRELVRFTAGMPVVLTGLWANHLYAVEEVAGRGFTATYQGMGSMQPRMLPEGGNMLVSVTNTYEPGGGENGSDLGRLRVSKANFVGTPAQPHETFAFVVRKGGNPMDLTEGSISVRKTGGSGSYSPVDLKNGRFTLTYDTEVTIEGLPLELYTVTEYATGYKTSYKVIDNSVTRPSDGAFVADITIIYTNEEIGGDTPPSGGDRPDTPEPGEVESDIYVTVEVSLGPTGAFPSTPDEPVNVGELPRTGNHSAAIPVLLLLLSVSFIGAAVSFYNLLKVKRQREE